MPCFCLSSCNKTEKFDSGGKVGDYLDIVDKADRNNEEIRIEGGCASACTMKLGAKKVCIYPDATLYFHQASDPNTGAHSDLGTLILYSEYPPNVKKWVDKHHALDTISLTPMSGKEAISLGIKECK